MDKLILTSATVLVTLAFGGNAYACEFHSGGYGLRNASWQSYNPQVSYTDPAFAETDIISPRPIRTAKTKPSFSNVANVAATKAKARLAKKQSEKKPASKADVKKAALNANR